METFTSKSDFLRRCFGDLHFSRCENNVAVECPSCGDKTQKKKFSINVNSWKCHCWVCGIKGKNLSRILSDHVSKDLSSEYCSRFLSDLDSSEQIAEVQEEKISIPEEFIPITAVIRSRDPDIRSCIRYLFSRDVSERDMWMYKLGIATYGRFRRRIIMPSFDEHGELNYFSARSIDDSRYKYINSKNKKIDIVFNEININWKEELVIVEGPFDLLKSGLNSTCLLGSNLSPSSLLFKKIVSFQTPIILALDSDMDKKTRKIADLLQDYSCQVRIIDTGKFNDVGEMSKHDFSKIKKEAYFWSRETSLIKKIGAIDTGSIF